MKIHRFFSSFPKDSKSFFIEDPDLVNQIRKVLRFLEGDKFVVCDGDCQECVVKIVQISNHKIEVKVLEANNNNQESKIKTKLYCSILKRDNFEWVIQKAVEVGVVEIIPLLCERTVKTNFKKDRLEKIAKEAAEQSGRGIIPIITNPLKFNDAVVQASKNDQNVFCHLEGGAIELSQSKSKSVGVFIGPEGGWDDKEIGLVKKSGFDIVSLGKFTLRAETAAVVATYLVANKIGL